MKEVPLFLINGFLECGKTSLIKEIVENNQEYQKGQDFALVLFVHFILDLFNWVHLNLDRRLGRRSEPMRTFRVPRQYPVQERP